MGKTIQAVSVIVTHRNDDMTTLFDSAKAAATLASAKAAQEAADAAAAAARPRISLNKSTVGSVGLGSSAAQDQVPGNNVSCLRKINSDGVTTAKASEKIESVADTPITAILRNANTEPVSNVPKSKAKPRSKAKIKSDEMGQENSVDDSIIDLTQATDIPRCPHVKPGKKGTSTTRCQECLREQAPEAELRLVSVRG